MNKVNVKRTGSLLIACAMLFLMLPYSNAVAVDTADNDTRYYIGNAVNAGKNTGYSEENAIKEDDPHFGWELGYFFLSGFTSTTKDEAGNPVILKTTGDKVTLWFSLEQDIDALNADDSLAIAEDKNGSDEYFGIEKTNFGRGTLIIRHTDYQNRTQKPILYTDYLSALIEGADTKVEVFEEGDYEVALDYELARDRINLFGWTPLHTYTNYRIFFRFSVRNGNCMIFPFDAVTHTELTNTSMTENGFYLDLAKSRYLDITVKKEMLAEGADGLIEDTRFNSLAKDGDRFTDEGIYTITVKNRYSGENTSKKIYVGTDLVLKAFVATGMSISEIKDYLNKGAHIADDGSIVFPQQTEPEVTPTPEPKPTIEPVTVIPAPTESEIKQSDSSTNAEDFIALNKNAIKIMAGVGVALAFLVYMIANQVRKGKQKALKAIPLPEAIEPAGEESDNQ